jgi:polyisoprenoid-binding protein YceI
MRSSPLHLPLALALAAAPGAAGAAPRSYALDPSASSLAALTKPAGLLAGLSHPHVVVARAARGAVVHDAEAPERDRVEVEVDARALEVDEPAERSRHGLTAALSPADRTEILARMRSAEQLDVERYPTIAFTSTAVRPGAPGHLEVTGKLTLHGRTVEVSLPVAVQVEGATLRASGTLRIGHAPFGMKPISIGLGAIRNAEEILLRIDLVAREQEAQPPASPAEPVAGPTAPSGP